MFSKKIELPVLTIEEILAGHKKLYERFYVFEPDFSSRSKIGALPACLDSPLPSIIESTVDKVIQKDMLTVGKLAQEDMNSIRSALLFIARSGIDGCCYSSISRNIGVSKYRSQQYIRIMEAVSLLQVVLPYGANVLPEPKILLTPTLRQNLAHGSDEDRLKGALREEFFIHHVCGANLTVNYLKSMRGQKLPDNVLFLNDRKLFVEIGGAGKTSSQFKGMDTKEKLILTQPAAKNGVPMI